MGLGHPRFRAGAENLEAVCLAYGTQRTHPPSFEESGKQHHVSLRSIDCLPAVGTGEGNAWPDARPSGRETQSGPRIIVGILLREPRLARHRRFDHRVKCRFPRARSASKGFLACAAGSEEALNI